MKKYSWLTKCFSLQNNKCCNFSTKLQLIYQPTHGSVDDLSTTTGKIELIRRKEEELRKMGVQDPKKVLQEEKEKEQKDKIEFKTMKEIQGIKTDNWE
ncbi:hypothetical protein ABK040_003734 [Willaertia magna]